MPPSGPSAPQEEHFHRKNAPPRKRPTGQPTGFTFVDQSADLRSIADKKIVDSDQRHLIRSHVMQKVRKDERLQGKRRPTGREGPRKESSSQGSSTSPTAASTPRPELLNSFSGRRDHNNISPPSSISPTGRASQKRNVTVPKSPSPGKLDPFNTLPGGLDLSKIVNQLLQYCFHEFIPMTFPVVSSTPREYYNWRMKVLRSQSANTATFFGMMATVAAHQAITKGRHKDLRPTLSNSRPSDLLIDDDFATMKTYALQATQERISGNGWDGPTVEAIFSLIAAEHILGNFDEARVHLSALKKFFVDVNGLDPASPASDWIPLTDVKGAIGTMGRPLFRLPWDPEPVPQDLSKKLLNWNAQELSSLGTAFSQVDDLESHLQSLLRQACVLCRFCQFNACCSSELTAKDHEVFRKKTLELEFDVLSYIYPGSPSNSVQVPAKISHVEQIARLAVLGFTSSNITKILPALGVGRALTHFQNLATREFYASLKRPPNKSTAQFIVWALMIFAQCASKQPEERFFVTSIAWYSHWAGITNWVSLESVGSSFLYVPAFQRTIWQQTWSKACQLQQIHIENRRQATTTPQSQTHRATLRPHSTVSFS